MPFAADMTKNPEGRTEKQKDCNEGIRLTRTTTKANRKVDRKETNDLPEKRSLQEHRKSASMESPSGRATKGRREETNTKKRKNFEFNEESKATEHTQTKEGKPKPAENKKPFHEKRLLRSGRKSMAEWETK
jgi:hypothetical protein